jgi:imidazolonepropionase-like amidohydrolase
MSQPLAFTNATVFDGHDLLNQPQTVILDGERIAAVDAHAPIPAGAQVIDLEGKTLIPGLIDAHFHCNSPEIDITRADVMPASLMSQYAARYLENALESGFTAVRDAGGADAGLARAVENGLIRGPRLFVCDRGLSQSGGHGDFGSRFPICPCHQYSGYISRVVDGVDEVRRTVRQQLRDGAHQIKLFVSGGILSPTDPIWMDQFTDTEIRAAVEEAQRWHTYVMAHALSTSSIRRCIALGVRSIEHGMQIDAATADALASSDCFVVPTLSIFHALSSGSTDMPPWALEKARGAEEEATRSLEQCLRAGVKLGLGTDLLGTLHGTESSELLLRARVGGALHTLRSATSVNATLLNMGDRLGAIRVGYYADLLVVDGNPLQDLSLLAAPAKGIVAILKGGEFVRNPLASRPGSGRLQQPRSA